MYLKYNLVVDVNEDDAELVDADEVAEAVRGGLLEKRIDAAVEAWPNAVRR